MLGNQTRFLAMTQPAPGRAALIGISLASLVVCLLPSGPCLAQQEATRVFQKVSPSVVGLSNIEGSGTGVLLDKSGLILTNAHVVASPIPFKCMVDVLRDGTTETVTFKKVGIIGRHPKKDLALVRIDPTEHSGELVPAVFTREPAVPGQQIYAIGDPAAGGEILNKTITQGLISGVDRMHEDVRYYQIDAAINPGNSGGPVVNSNGEVIGISTLKFTEVERVGFVLPIHDFTTTSIKPWKKKKVNKTEARAAMNEAKRFLREAETHRRKRKDHPMIAVMHFLALQKYHEALESDPQNWAIYWNCALLLGSNEKPEAAAEYLVQALSIEPWGGSDDRIYRQLGLYLEAVDETGKAALIWREGLTKFPRSGWCWEQFAKSRKAMDKHAEAAVAAAAVLELKPRQSDLKAMESILAQSRKRIPDDEKSQVEQRLNSLSGVLAQMQDQADDARRAGKTSMTNEFETYLKQNLPSKSLVAQNEVVDIDSFFKESPNHQPAASAASAAPVESTMTEGDGDDDFDSIDEFLAEDNEQSARQLLKTAEENRQQGNLEQADEQLNRLLERYPETSVAEKARELLGMPADNGPADNGPADNGPVGGLRVWSDSTGRYNVQAAFLDRLGDTIRLRTAKGKIVTLSLERLSDFDRRYIEKNHPEK